MEEASAVCSWVVIKVGSVQNRCALRTGVARDAPYPAVQKEHKALVSYVLNLLSFSVCQPICAYAFTRVLFEQVVVFFAFPLIGTKCIIHGGGKRCGFEGCMKIAQRGGRCSSHGGGRRCAEPGCNKHAQGRTLRCVKHGGGRRCEIADCPRSAAGRTTKCVKHGGGTRCTVEGCNRLAKSGGKCRGHGGGRRCAFVDPETSKACTK